MRKKLRKSIEDEIPELTPEQKKYQKQILNDLGRAVFCEARLRRLGEAEARVYQIHLPNPKKY